MKNSSSHIGKKLHFDQFNFDWVCGYWDRSLLPAIKNLADSYNDLSIHTLNQETFEKIVNSGIKFVEQEHKDALMNERESIKKTSKAIAQAINLKIDSDELIAFRKSYKELKFTIDTINMHISSSVQSFNITDCKIVKGKPVINKDEIRKRFTIQIDSEVKDEFYNQLLVTIQEWNKLRVIADSHRGNRSFRPRIFADKEIDPRLDEGFLMEDENGMLTIIEKNFNDLFS